MRTLLIATALLAAPGFAKVKAAPIEQVRTCLYDSLDEPSRKAVAASLIADIDKKDPEPAAANEDAAQVARDDPAVDALADRAGACAARHKWSDSQIQAAVGWTMMTVAEPTMRARAAAVRLDFAAAERTAQALSPADRVLLIEGAGEGADELGKRLLAAAANSGIVILARNDDERAEMVGVLVGFLIMRDRYRADLGAR